QRSVRIIHKNFSLLTFFLNGCKLIEKKLHLFYRPPFIQCPRKGRSKIFCDEKAKQTFDN
ncbi:hypothetical protein ACEW7V_01325, partial [Areca yellow leaf disease phytoplasma]|uniref:hypothetical protein n=1 Tax=Areca yellow leaf disease phytoplasma TaxID=927614 RepID=UPI0035B516FF